MTEQQLHEIIRGGESLMVEFKSEAHGAVPEEELVQDVVCLANRSEGETGWLLLGVEDDGRITGAAVRHGTETDVVLVLHGGEPNLDFVRLVVEENQSGRVLGMEELLVLNHLWQERQTSTAEIARLIQKPEADARALMQRLVEAGLVESRGVRKGRTYHLSASTYRRLGMEADYVRLRGFEPLQMEQMVLQYVQKFGSISRSRAATLCRIKEPQAYYLLRKLVHEGKLIKKGQGRNAHYTLGGKNA